MHRPLISSGAVFKVIVLCIVLNAVLNNPAKATKVMAVRNVREIANIPKKRVIRAVPPRYRIPLYEKSPSEAIIIELMKAPVPIDVNI